MHWMISPFSALSTREVLRHVGRASRLPRRIDKEVPPFLQRHYVVLSLIVVIKALKNDQAPSGKPVSG